MRPVCGLREPIAVIRHAGALFAIALMLLASCRSSPPIAATARILVPAAGEATIAELEALKPPKFILGELASEKPRHEVRLTAGYWIDK